MDALAIRQVSIQPNLLPISLVISLTILVDNFSLSTDYLDNLAIDSCNSISSTPLQVFQSGKSIDVTVTLETIRFYPVLC